MAWFDDLKTTLPTYYPGGPTDTVVGYLRGSADPAVWQTMEMTRTAQAIMLGSVLPTKRDWDAAGVAQRGDQQTITITMLAGFIVLYDGFMYRPWGKIFVKDDDATRTFPHSLESWRRNNKWEFAKEALRQRRSFAQYSRRFLISRSKPRSGGS